MSFLASPHLTSPRLALRFMTKQHPHAHPCLVAAALDAARRPQGYSVLAACWLARGLILKQAMQPAQSLHSMHLKAVCAYVQGHSIRLALSGADSKHFYVDRMGTKTMWLHTGPGRQSAIHLYVVSQNSA